MSVGTFNLWPNKLVIGSGKINEISAEIKALGKERVIVFTDEGMKDFPMISDLVSLLENEGFSVSLFSNIGPNPTDTMVMDAVEDMKKHQPDVIVCIGGGSPIDAAKAANVVYTHGGEVGEYDISIGGIERITPKLLPFIAIPTTAGTGTEVSFASVITDSKKHIKYGVLSPLLIPDIAILDANLTLSMPASLTAFTGIDALTHAIEAYFSLVDFSVTNGIAIQAIKMLNNSLEAVVKDGSNLEAREEVLEASMLAGIAFTTNGLGLTHQMAHQLSAYFNVPHGLANAILLPSVMKFNMPSCVQKFADIAQALGADTKGLSVEEAAQKSVDIVEALCEAVSIPKYLDEIGVSKDKVPQMVESALADPVGMNNPIQTTPAECEKIYMDLFKS